MTELQLRQNVCNIINSWKGAARGSATHLEILKIYNEHKPLARGYAVKVNDAHCATTTSAAWIKAGIADYTGTECSVYYFVEIAKKKGIWVENDAHIPQIGDAIVYDWQDSGSGDNTGNPDHIGIVTQVNGVSSFVVTEGNTNGGRVDTRVVQVNARYIRGFICPDYVAIARALTGTAADTVVAPAKPVATTSPASQPATAAKTVKATEAARRFDKTLAGTYKVTASALNIRNGAGTTKNIFTSLPNGTKVQNYGYYTQLNGVKWLYVQVTYNGVQYTAFASGQYLQKV